MFALKNAVRFAPQVRQMSAMGTRPLVRISFTEKLVHGVIMTAGYCAIPAWVLYHLRSYRGLDK